jgi:hypothetical protein
MRVVFSMLVVLTVLSFGISGTAQEMVIDSAHGGDRESLNGSSTTVVETPSLAETSYSSSKDIQAEAAPLVLRANLDPTPLSNSAMFAINPVVAPVAPVKPSLEKESARNKRIWLSLTAVNHGAATFDAWSTRAAVGRGAQEVNPLLKPFANSNAMYGAVQVVPFGMDYLGRRMMRSNNATIRKLWWVPQTASAICSLTAGIHNMGVNTR